MGAFVRGGMSTEVFAVAQAAAAQGAAIAAAAADATTKSNNIALGVGQAVVDVLSSRQSGVTYTNTTGKVIAVNVACLSNTSGGDTILEATVGGVLLGRNRAGSTNGLNNSSLFFLVKPGSSYMVNLGGSGTPSLIAWAELR